MDAKTLAAIDRSVVWHPFTQHADWEKQPPVVIEKGAGVYLFDVEGNRYIDGVSSLWVNVHGHGHPHLLDAIREQSELLQHSTLLGLASTASITFAKALVDKSLPGLTRVFYSDSGSTSVEIALKMAFQWQQQQGHTKRTRFVAMSEAYHGDTIGSVSVGGIDLFHAIYRPLLFDAHRLEIPGNREASAERQALNAAKRLFQEHGDEIAAFVFEPLVQGAAGMRMHTPEFLAELCALAKQAGVLLIADEVATGFGRTGTLFAMEQVGISPDFLCAAKGITGGTLPLAATLTTEAIYEGFKGKTDEYRTFFHGHTYTGNPIACAVALASLELFESEGTLLNVRERAVQLEKRLAQMAGRKFIRGFRQQGLMAGVDLGDPEGNAFLPNERIGHKVCMACRPRGAILRPLGDTVILMPPLCISSAALDELLDILNDAITDVLGD